MADNPDLTQGDASGGQVAMREKAVPGGATAQVQRVTTMDCTTVAMATGIIIEDVAGGELVFAMNADDGYREIEVLTGEIRISGSGSGTNSDATGRRVAAGGVWSTERYAGDVYARGVGGAATIAIERGA